MNFIYLFVIIIVFLGLLKAKYLNISATISSILLLAILGINKAENISAGFLICFVYVILAFAHYYRKNERKEIYAKFNEKISSKAFVNVLGKVSLIVLAAAIQNNAMFLALLSYGFADSLASQIGIFTKSKTISIISLKEVPPGTNGGVSLLGVFLGIIGGFVLILLSIFLFPDEDLKILIIFGMIGAIIGNLIDSVLGEIIENRFNLFDWINNLFTEILIVIICLLIQIVCLME